MPMSARKWRRFIDGALGGGVRSATVGYPIFPTPSSGKAAMSRKPIDRVNDDPDFLLLFAGEALVEALHLALQVLDKLPQGGTALVQRLIDDDEDHVFLLKRLTR